MPFEHLVSSSPHELPRLILFSCIVFFLFVVHKTACQNVLWSVRESEADKKHRVFDQARWVWKDP